MCCKLSEDVYNPLLSTIEMIWLGLHAQKSTTRAGVLFDLSPKLNMNKEELSQT